MIDIKFRQRGVHVYPAMGEAGFIRDREETVKLNVVNAVIEQGGGSGIALAGSRSNSDR